MLLINQITDAPRQIRNLLLENGEPIDLDVEYLPQQMGWFIRQLTFNTFTVRNIRITNNLNILFQFQNIIPFGLACVTDSGREPFRQDDFLSGDFKLFILTESEVEEFSGFVREQI